MWKRHIIKYPPQPIAKKTQNLLMRSFFLKNCNMFLLQFNFNKFCKKNYMFVSSLFKIDLHKNSSKARMQSQKRPQIAFYL